MKDGFLKVCAATPAIVVADCVKNGEAILTQIREAAALGVKIIVFPELCITGATCGDLFRSPVLVKTAADTLAHLMQETKSLDILCAVGMPVQSGYSVYNCCVLFHNGAISHITAKQHLSPAEQRVFTPLDPTAPTPVADHLSAAIGNDTFLVVNGMDHARIAVEIGSDADALIPVSTKLVTEHGVSVILHPSASPETVVAAEERLEFHKTHSRKLCCAYITAEAGQGESTTDSVWAGHRLIAENGNVLAESPLFSTGLTITEIDVDYLCSKRMERNFPTPTTYATPTLFGTTPKETTLTRHIPQNPFLPTAEETEIVQRIETILNLQCSGLGQRICHTHCRTPVLGLSGGLDSTLALLVVARTFDKLHMDRKQILAISMPCFGTTSRTKSNAQLLAEALGVSFREIEIGASVRQHFLDIGQSMENHDVTFENGQARERTQVLMDVANQMGGMVIGTGDLSELALGWATYNGDHMSMYAVNASIPKTLMRHMVSHIAKQSDDPLKAVLLDILDTPVSPELLPAKDGEIAQITEELVGPYELHDFFLYHALGNHFPPEKIARLANIAFADCYPPEVIDKWLQNFYHRFFQQQFKRSCLPDGPAVGSITVSPRGGLVMPSDASAAMWKK